MGRHFVKLIIVLCLFISANAVAESFTQQMSVDWSSSLKNNLAGVNKALNFSTPVVCDDKVYIGSSKGFFYSINAVTGKKQWTKELAGPVLSKPLCDGSAIYLGDGKGYVYSLSKDTGIENWRAFIGEEVMSTPVADGNNVYVATNNNSLFALSKDGGAIAWSSRRSQPFSPMSIRGFSSPILIDGKIYIGNTDGVLVVYNAKDGAKLSTIPLASGRGIFTDIDSLVLDGSKILFSSMEGSLVCMDVKTHKEYWTANVGTPNNVFASGGNIFAVANAKVISLSAADGKVVWESPLPEVLEGSAPVATEQYVIVASTDDKIFFLNREDGKIIFKRHLGGGTFGSPIMNGEQLLVMTNGGQLYAFKVK